MHPDIAYELAKMRQEKKDKQPAKTVQVAIADSGKISRNGPCPCGSKRKFKKCCLQKVRSGALPALRGAKTK